MNATGRGVVSPSRGKNRKERVHHCHKKVEKQGGLKQWGKRSPRLEMSLPIRGKTRGELGKERRKTVTSQGKLTEKKHILQVRDSVKQEESAKDMLHEQDFKAEANKRSGDPYQKGRRKKRIIQRGVEGGGKDKCLPRKGSRSLPGGEKEGTEGLFVHPWEKKLTHKKGAGWKQKKGSNLKDKKRGSVGIESRGVLKKL